MSKLRSPDLPRFGIGRDGTVTVTYTNTGDTDALAPLIDLTATNAEISLPDEGQFTGSTVQFLGISSTGPAGILRPGESQQMQIPFQAAASGGEASVEVQVADDSQPMDWADQEAALRESTIPLAAWTLYANLVQNLGSTVASYNQALANDASYLSQFGEYIYDVNYLFNFEIEKADDDFIPASMPSGTDIDTPEPGMDLMLVRSFDPSISGRYQLGPFGLGWTDNWQIDATTDSQGNVTMQSGSQLSYFALQPGGTYLGYSGNLSVLSLVNGAYQLLQPDGTLIAFDTNGSLNYIEDSNGNRITAAYNSENQMASVTDSDGQAIKFSYNVQGLINSATDPFGRVTSYAYDPTGQYLLSMTDENGTTSYAYVTGESAAQNNAIASITTAAGTILNYSYDSQGRPVNQQFEGGADNTTYAYLTPGGYLTTDPDGNQTTAFFDYQGNTTEIISPEGEATYYTYDANGDLLSMVAPNGAEYSYTYNTEGELTNEMDPLGNVVTLQYNAASQLVSSTDPDGNTTQYQPDANGNLLSVTYASGDQESYTYNPEGEATQLVDANGQAVSYTYNTNGLVTGETFSDGTTFTYQYNDRGDLASTTD